MGVPAPACIQRSWSLWDLSEDERETVLFLRRVMRERGNTCAFMTQIDEAINRLRSQIDDQRERHRAWRSRQRWWRVWQQEEEPFNPDAYQLPLVATADGWVQFMLCIEALRRRGILREKRLEFPGSLEYMYWFLD